MSQQQVAILPQVSAVVVTVLVKKSKYSVAKFQQQAVFKVQVSAAAGAEIHTQVLERISQ